MVEQEFGMEGLRKIRAGRQEKDNKRNIAVATTIAHKHIPVGAAASASEFVEGGGRGAGGGGGGRRRAEDGGSGVWRQPEEPQGIRQGGVESESSSKRQTQREGSILDIFHGMKWMVSQGRWRDHLTTLTCSLEGKTSAEVFLEQEEERIRREQFDASSTTGRFNKHLVRTRTGLKPPQREAQEHDRVK
eukprot:479252-Hanusia_phi.AAC.1